MIQSLQKALQRYVAEVKHAMTPRGYSFSQELVLFDFIKEGALSQWECISDTDIGGQSNATLQPNGQGRPACLLVIILVCECLLVLQVLVCCLVENWTSLLPGT